MNHHRRPECECANCHDCNGGNDALTGGFGLDTFVFNANDGSDTINDFENGLDKLDLTSLSTSFGALTITDVGVGDVIVDYGTGLFRLRNTTAADLDAGDFLF